MKDVVSLAHENGAQIRVRIDALQPENVFIGTVLTMSRDAPGYLNGDVIATHLDFVYVVERSG